MNYCNNHCHVRSTPYILTEPWYINWYCWWYQRNQLDSCNLPVIGNSYDALIFSKMRCKCKAKAPGPGLYQNWGLESRVKCLSQILVKPQYRGFTKNKGPEVRVMGVSWISVKPGPWALTMLRDHGTKWKILPTNIIPSPIFQKRNSLWYRSLVRH
jgi:hypothetical protein